MTEYRPVPESRRAAFARIFDDAFDPVGGPHPGDEAAWERIGDPRGLFDGPAADADLLSICRHIDFTARLRGTTVSMAGLAAVATPPEHRRRGHVAELLAASLAEYRERDWHVAALWPFDYAFYRRFGWATVNRRARFDCPPDALEPVADATGGQFHRVDADDWETLRPVHEACHGDRALCVERTEAWWRERIVAGDWRDEPYVYRWDRDGDPAAYVVYRVGEADGDRYLSVAEMAYADHEAYRHLLRFLRDHDSQVGEIRVVELPVDGRILDVVADPEAVDYRVRAGPMFRIVDVPDAITDLSYPGVDGAFTLAVTDGVADWNDATFRVTVRDGAADVDRVAAAPREDADVVADVGALSQVYAGYHSVAESARLSGLDAGGARETLAAMFPPQSVFLTEGF